MTPKQKKAHKKWMAKIQRDHEAWKVRDVKGRDESVHIIWADKRKRPTEPGDYG